jgi:hypothetical protein
LPTEVDIRNGIAARIKATVPSAVVKSRDIIDTVGGAWLSDLEDADGKVHSYVVTLEAMTLIEPQIGSARYKLRYSVWRIQDCETGSDSANSEDQGSAERELVVNAFANQAALPAVLSNCEPLQFARIGLRYVGDKCVHIDEGSIEVEWVTNCS